MADTPTPEGLKEKLLRALKAKAVLSERAKQLEQQVEDSRRREEAHNHVVSEMLDRQREMNFMLHRANSVLHRLQETNLALSSEFTELVKELPAPDNPEWETRVAKINDLFKRTGDLADEVQDEVFKRDASPREPESIHIPERQPVPAAAQHEPEAVQPEPAEADFRPVEPNEEPAEPLTVHPEEPAAEAEFVPTASPEPEPAPVVRDERLERLFKRLEAVDPQVRAASEDQEEEDSGAPAGFWTRLTRRGKNRSHFSDDSIDQAS